MDFESLKLAGTTEDGKIRNLELWELDIPNIEEIIDRYEMERSYTLRYKVQDYRKNAKNGNISDEEIQELTNLRDYNRKNVGIMGEFSRKRVTF